MTREHRLDFDAELSILEGIGAKVESLGGRVRLPSGVEYEISYIPDNPAGATWGARVALGDDEAEGLGSTAVEAVADCTATLLEVLGPDGDGWILESAQADLRAPRPPLTPAEVMDRTHDIASKALP